MLGGVVLQILPEMIAERVPGIYNSLHAGGPGVRRLRVLVMGMKDVRENRTECRPIKRMEVEVHGSPKAHNEDPFAPLRHPSTCVNKALVNVVAQLAEGAHDYGIRATA